jgi:hypothetical protein
MKIYFLTFGNNKYNSALNRIKVEAELMNIFDYIDIYNEDKLKSIPEFWNKHKDFIRMNKRGYGYWIWKSFLTQLTLNKMNNNDILIYADAGCEFNILGKSRLLEYINIVNNSQYGILSFQLGSIHLEKRWTKMDLFHYLNCCSLDNTQQLVGGIYIIMKNDHTIKLVNEWYKICCNYNLIDDSKCISKNDDIFVEHRHDQSVFSLLRKIHGTDILEDETYPPKNKKFPIWASRKLD